MSELSFSRSKSYETEARLSPGESCKSPLLLVSSYGSSSCVNYSVMRYCDVLKFLSMTDEDCRGMCRVSEPFVSDCCLSCDLFKFDYCSASARARIFP